MSSAQPLSGTRIAITRPAGQGAAFARRVRALGGSAFTLPGSSLQGSVDDATRTQLATALACDVAIFTSPVAVRFARALRPLAPRATALAPGAGTRRALLRAGVRAETPREENSEGLLALPALKRVRGRRIGLVGAAGGRGLLQRELAARGAIIVEAHVYQRRAARLTRRHVEALLLRARRAPLYVPLSSSEALANLLAALPAPACATLRAGTAVASSARIATAARGAGFARVLQAASAHAGDLIDRIVADRASQRT